MSSPSDPQPPVEPTERRQPTTREIPVLSPGAGPSTGSTAAAPLPPHPGAIAPAPVPPAPPPPLNAPEPTGPVDFVPGLPGAGTPAPRPPAAPATPAAPAAATASWPETLEPDAPAPDRPVKTKVPVAPRSRAALVGLGLVGLALVLLELGLALNFGNRSYWSTVPLWSAFATVCAVLGLLAFAAFYPAGNRLRSGPAWRVAAAGLVGVAVFWLLVVLPVVDTDRGFLITAALAALGGALWIGPRRKD